MDQNPRQTSVLTGALVSAVIVPQIGVGMIVPALPVIARDFHVPVSSAQGTLIIYMVGYAISMLISGLLSEYFGPRKVQIWGLGLAGSAAMVAALAAPAIATLYVARLVQALGGCVGTVTTRLIISKKYTANDRMNILTTLASALAITPCLAPLAGGALLPYMGWRGLFGTIALISFGALIFFMCATRHMALHTKHSVPLSQVGIIYLRNLKRPRFIFYAVSISFVWMSYFTFISVSSGPLQLYLGLSAFHYGAILGLAAIGYILGSMSARRLAKNKDIDFIIGRASLIGLSGAALLVAMTATFPEHILSILLPVSALLFATGMIIPSAQAGLLRCATQDAGVSSGLFFFIQMIAGACYAALGNMWQDMTPLILATLVAMPAIALPFVLRLVDVQIKRVEGLVNK